MTWKRRLIQGAVVAAVAVVVGTIAAVYSAPQMVRSTTLPLMLIILASVGFFFGMVFKIRV